MKEKLLNLTYEIEVLPGEKLTLPDSLLEKIDAGRWIITIQPSTEENKVISRSHDAFLNGYEIEDEVLYDDYPSRLVLGSRDSLY
jgi:hypothetical protein